MNAEDAEQLKVRNVDGDMAPLGAVVDIRDSTGPLTVTRSPVDGKPVDPKQDLLGAWCRELLPNRNERSHPRIT